MNYLIRSLLILAAIFSQLSFSQQIPPKRELRGAWVASVANIDWPVDKYSTPGEQIASLVSIMDKLKSAGINAVFFQIRTECDALYNSQYEPWSYWLTGKQGRAPFPYYDPLEFAISEAHSRGMELHAWFNPYRAVKKIGDYEPSEGHPAVLHPEWILTFKDYKMLDPGLPEVKNYILNVVTDVLERYDIDGIHFDDYFYPYTPITNEDSLTFARYKGAFTNIADWRRNNINSLMAAIYDKVNKINKKVKFGISPFGIVENKYAGTSGFNSYDVLYCDPLTWIKNRSVDYVNPQLYWEIGHAKASYSKLLPWWASVTDGCHLYIGQYSSSMAGPNYKGQKDELGRQLLLNRSTNNVHGEVFFSSKSITNNYSGFADTLKNNYYKYPALPPLMPWKDNIAPEAPENLTVKCDTAGALLEWQAPAAARDNEKVNYFIIYRFETGSDINLNDPRNIIATVPGARRKYRDQFKPGAGSTYTYIITSADRLHNESENYAKAECRF